MIRSSKSSTILQNADALCITLFLFQSPVIHSDPLLRHPPPALFPPEPFSHPHRNMAGAPFPIMLCLHLTHQTVAVPAARAPAQITTRQLIELFFSSQAGGHCKNIPTLEYGFLVQVRPQGDTSLLHRALIQPVLRESFLPSVLYVRKQQ